VPVDVAPPVTVLGFSDTDETVGAVMAKAALAEVAFTDAVMFAVAFAATGVVETVNVPVVAPPAIVAVPPTVADVLSEANVIVRPAAGAAELIVIVPVDDVPPTTVAGLSVKPVTVGAVIARAAFCDEPFELAVMFAVAFVATGRVVIVTVPERAPAGMIAVPGTAAALSDVTETVSPPAGAAELIEIVPVEGTPPATVAGLSANPKIVGP